ncbi:L-asparaginase (predicted) [Sugiyamaella lignohabitans]|uniref:L-asparaginase (Predicted) n=1 Tax=Sugiyamaella lignohabitans TaxID=796027 RepID=A0A167F5M9_9ASCO|nr:L-asparaginase (predicted) [Sugiyamaella lignohabitans]ANB14859.1 L-asparaginase (predicted) [Sugiyamaella lignohabitans]
MLEDSPLTNAGTGSNLNSLGNVECDASIIDSKTMLGTGVAALSGVKNPISVAKKLGDDIIAEKTCQSDSGSSDTTGTSSTASKYIKWGLSRPLFLSGTGAYDYSVSSSCELISPTDQKTAAAQRYFDKWSAIIGDPITPNTSTIDANGFTSNAQAETYSTSTSTSSTSNNNYTTGDPSASSLVDGDSDLDEKLNDTVGVICGDRYGNIALCSSSGGNSLKPPGRIGPAALIGPGTALKKQLNSTNATRNTVTKITACCSTGHGEDIITTNLSALVCDKLISAADNENDILTSLFKNDLPNTFPYLQSSPLYLGCLTVSATYGTNNPTHHRPLLTFAHTTESMIISYASPTHPRPTVIKSRTTRAGRVSVGGALL